MLLFMFSQKSLAQPQPGTMPGAQRDTTTHRGMMMSSPIMGEVREDCQKSKQSAGTALSAIRAAKNSSNPKVLKDALDKAEQELAEIQSNMTSAMNKMGSMRGSRNTQGGTQGMQQQRPERDHVPGVRMDSTKRMNCSTPNGAPAGRRPQKVTGSRFAHDQ